MNYNGGKAEEKAKELSTKTVRHSDGSIETTILREDGTEESYRYFRDGRKRIEIKSPNGVENIYIKNNKGETITHQGRCTDDSRVAANARVEFAKREVERRRQEDQKKKIDPELEQVRNFYKMSPIIVGEDTRFARHRDGSLELINATGAIMESFKLYPDGKTEHKTSRNGEVKIIIKMTDKTVEERKIRRDGIIDIVKKDSQGKVLSKSVEYPERIERKQEEQQPQTTTPKIDRRADWQREQERIKQEASKQNPSKMPSVENGLKSEKRVAPAKIVLENSKKAESKVEEREQSHLQIEGMKQQPPQQESIIETTTPDGLLKVVVENGSYKKITEKNKDGKVVRERTEFKDTIALSSETIAEEDREIKVDVFRNGTKTTTIKNKNGVVECLRQRDDGSLMVRVCDYPTMEGQDIVKITESYLIDGSVSRIMEKQDGSIRTESYNKDDSIHSIIEEFPNKEKIETLVLNNIEVITQRITLPNGNIVNITETFDGKEIVIEETDYKTKKTSITKGRVGDGVTPTASSHLHREIPTHEDLCKKIESIVESKKNVGHHQSKPVAREEVVQQEEQKVDIQQHNDEIQSTQSTKLKKIDVEEIERRYEEKIEELISPQNEEKRRKQAEKAMIGTGEDYETCYYRLYWEERMALMGKKEQEINIARQNNALVDKAIPVLQGVQQELEKSKDLTRQQEPVGHVDQERQQNSKDLERKEKALERIKASRDEMEGVRLRYIDIEELKRTHEEELRRFKESIDTQEYIEDAYDRGYRGEDIVGYIRHRIKNEVEEIRTRQREEIALAQKNNELARSAEQTINATRKDMSAIIEDLQGDLQQEREIQRPKEATVEEIKQKYEGRIKALRTVEAIDRRYARAFREKERNESLQDCYNRIYGMEYRELIRRRDEEIALAEKRSASTVEDERIKDLDAMFEEPKTPTNGIESLDPNIIK